MDYQMYQNYLMHYGVPGMKWGVRKSKLKTMSRSEKKSVKARYKKNLKSNRKQLYKSYEKANKNYDKNISEYTKASNKMNKKFDRDLRNIEKTNREYSNKVSMFGGNSAVANAIKSNIKTNEISKKQIVEGKRNIAQKSLNMKYSDLLSRADKTRDNEIRVAINKYKDNKKKIKSGTYK